MEKGTTLVKRGMAQMQKGGVIMDVANVEQAKIAEAAGAVAVMALERVPSDIRAAGGVARMSDPAMVEQIMAAVTIPVMAKARIGHFVEARVLEAVGVDYIDESEVPPQQMTPTTLIKRPLRCHLCVAAVIWAKPYAGLVKGLQCYGPKANQGRTISLKQSATWKKLMNKLRKCKRPTRIN